MAGACDPEEPQSYGKAAEDIVAILKSMKSPQDRIVTLDFVKTQICFSCGSAEGRRCDCWLSP